VGRCESDFETCLDLHLVVVRLQLNIFEGARLQDRRLNPRTVSELGDHLLLILVLENSHFKNI